MTKSLLACIALSFLVAPALADTPAPREDGKGHLKPGQATGPRKCLGSTAGINVDASSKKTIGVANCRLQIEKAFKEKEHVCDGKAKRTKVEYSWQFGEGEYATTGKHYFTCP